MQEKYERVLQKAKDELDVLRKEVDMTHQDLITTQNWYVCCWKKNMVLLKLDKVSMVVSNMTDQLICRCKEKEMEVEELKQQLKTEKIRKKRATEDHCRPENEDQWLKDLQCRLDEEKHRSANVELQVRLHWTADRNAYSSYLLYEEKAIKRTFRSSGKSHSEVYVKSTPCRPGEDCRAGATGVTATLTFTSYISFGVLFSVIE